MRCLFILLLFSCLLYRAISRPAEADNQQNDSELEEADYEKNDATSAEDGPRDDEDTPLNDQTSKVSGHEEDAYSAPQMRLDRNEYFGQNVRASSDERMNRRSGYNNFPEFKSSQRIETRNANADMNNQDSANSKLRRSHRYLGDNTPVDQFVQNPDNPSSGFEDNQGQNDVLRNDAVSKRRSDARQDDNSDLLFDTESKREQVNNVKKNDRYDESAEPSGQAHLYRKYYNALQTENKEYEERENDENRQEESNRGRREVQDLSAEGGSIEESKEKEIKDFNKVRNEDDQAAIKRHIKNLSSDELTELLNSLSEDKRALLQKIIDKDYEPNILNKREITKKAGAVEENNDLDGGQLDSNKIPGPSLNMNTDISVSQNSENTETTKASPSEIGDTVSSTKNVEINSIAYSANKEPTNSNEETMADKVEGNVNSVAPTAEQATLKNENKREVDSNAFGNDESFDSDFNSNESFDPSNDQSYVCSQDEDMSQLIDDEAQLHYDNRNTRKREALHENDADISDSMKSLQESFPNSYTFDDSGPYAGSDMAPLIRVKRRFKKHAVKKRAAAILPESKVAYVPYRAENEDEDNDEGNEFYDDGFFDRTASFAKSNINKQNESRRKLLKMNTMGKTSGAKRSNFANSLNTNTMSIGSDTDSVLSGVEGVDENLMYNGGARKKRAVDKGSKLEPADDLINEDLLTCPQSSKTSTANGNIGSESFTNGINFASNEAFGPLPRKYDGELGRYKRIRRLEKSVNSKELSSTKAIVE